LKSGDFVLGAISLLKEAIGKLNKLVRNEKISIIIQQPTYVSLENKKVIKEISAENPDWVSWNNCLDYMKISDFHKLAKLCSAPSNTIHLGYSMNWVTMAVGEHMKEFMEKSRDAVDLQYIVNGVSDMLLKPPIDNPINVMDCCLRMVTYHQWAEVFFKFVPKLIKVERTGYNIFFRTCDGLLLAWSYDENLEVNYYQE
jgi:hypothetical protein